MAIGTFELFHSPEGSLAQFLSLPYNLNPWLQALPSKETENPRSLNHFSWTDLLMLEDSYPVASLSGDNCSIPSSVLPGFTLQAPPPLGLLHRTWPILLSQINKIIE